VTNPKREGTVILILALLLLVGCAARPPHAKITQPPSLDCTPDLEKAHTPCLLPPHIDQDGYLVQSWEPSQLTPVGCWLHRIVFFGDWPMECKRVTEAEYGRFLSKLVEEERRQWRRVD
jgi:hypothetical protein